MGSEAEMGSAASRNHGSTGSNEASAPSNNEPSSTGEIARDRPKHVVPFWNRTNRKAPSKAGAEKVADGDGDGKQKGSKTTCGDSRGPGSTNNTDLKRPREESGKGGGVKDGRVLRYQFRAGYTNAVRRPVRMKDLL